MSKAKDVAKTHWLSVAVASRGEGPDIPHEHNTEAANRLLQESAPAFVEIITEGDGQPQRPRRPRSGALPSGTKL